MLEVIESYKVASDTTAPGGASSSSYKIKSFAMTRPKFCGPNVITCLSGKWVGLSDGILPSMSSMTRYPAPGAYPGSSRASNSHADAERLI